MMQATADPEAPGLRRSEIARAVADSDDPALLRSVLALLELIGRARRDEANSRMKVLGAVLDAPVLGRDVAAELGIDASTVSRHIASLEADGLLERRRTQGDRRAQPVMATEAGRAVYADSLRTRLAVFTQAVAHWAPDERRLLATLLGRLVADVDALQPTTAPERTTPRSPDAPERNDA